jgi:hypothetical protein
MWIPLINRRYQHNLEKRRIHMEKKTWIEPELIVIVRSKPEEAVLTACKTTSPDGGNVVLASNCGNPGGGYCGECTASAAS